MNLNDNAWSDQPCWSDQALKEKMAESAVNTAKTQSIPRPGLPRWMKLAASFTIIFLAGYVLFRALKNRPEKVLSGDMVKVVSLPDGSMVTLNRHSSISYGRNFGNKDRELNLTGEGYFDVAYIATKKFLVYTGQAAVEVTGTSFNIKTSDKSDRVEVVVSSGTVLMYDKKNNLNKITLHKGNSGVFERMSRNLVKSDSGDLNLVAWKTGKFVFNNDSLGYVADMLNRTYRSRVEFRNKSLERCRITISFDNQSLENILEIIKSTLGIMVIKENNTYFVDGPGC